MNSSSHPGAFHFLDALANCGLRDVVISPGSRHAPLVIAADSHPMLQVTVALDERSAAHIALGMGLERRIPAVVISTSGTAAVNHGPALAEAHFQRVPLISITADRPAERRKEGLGQVAHQKDLFSVHTQFETEVDELTADENQIRAKARKAWFAAAAGAVHVNIPFEEPLYDRKEWDIGPRNEAEVELSLPTQSALPENLLDQFSSHAPRVLLLAGALPFDSKWSHIASTLSNKLAVFADVFSHLRNEDLEGSAERFLAGNSGDFPQDLHPNCIVSIGLPPMSKQLRSALAASGAIHWHIGTEDSAWDFFGNGVQQWKVPAIYGLKVLLESLPDHNAYARSWNVRVDQTRAAEQRALASLDRPWSDWMAFSMLSSRLGKQNSAEIIHFANSTAARYAQWFPWNVRRLHANRGIAGIDGCLSTAVGDALAHAAEDVVLISGDLAWVYDLNGLMVKPIPMNLKVIVINNGGGNIFRWLEGPKEVGLLESHFEVPFLNRTESSAKLVGLDYFRVNQKTEFAKVFDAWSNNKGPALLEIVTSGPGSSDFFQELRDEIRRALELLGNTSQ